MEPTQVPEAQQAARPWARSVDIGPPAGHENIPSLVDCGSLPTLVENVDGARKVRSYWKPDEDELKALADGGTVELVVFFWPMVPVAINVVGGSPRAQRGCSASGTGQCPAHQECPPGWCKLAGNVATPGPE